MCCYAVQKKRVTNGKLRRSDPSKVMYRKAVLKNGKRRMNFTSLLWKAVNTRDALLYKIVRLKEYVREGGTKGERSNMGISDDTTQF